MAAELLRLSQQLGLLYDVVTCEWVASSSLDPLSSVRDSEATDPTTSSRQSLLNIASFEELADTAAVFRLDASDVGAEGGKIIGFFTFKKRTTLVVVQAPPVVSRHDYSTDAGSHLATAFAISASTLEKKHSIKLWNLLKKLPQVRVPTAATESTGGGTAVRSLASYFQRSIASLPSGHVCNFIGLQRVGAYLHREGHIAITHINMPALPDVIDPDSNHIPPASPPHHLVQASRGISGPSSTVHASRTITVEPQVQSQPPPPSHKRKSIFPEIEFFDGPKGSIAASANDRHAAQNDRHAAQRSMVKKSPGQSHREEASPPSSPEDKSFVRQLQKAVWMHHYYRPPSPPIRTLPFLIREAPLITIKNKK
jgi:hypothetical protein